MTHNIFPGGGGGDGDGGGGDGGDDVILSVAVAQQKNIFVIYSDRQQSIPEI